MASVKPNAAPASSRAPAAPARRIPLVRIFRIALGVVIVVGVIFLSWRTLSLSRAQGALTGTGWGQLVVQGVARGSIYALIAIGYSLVYGILLMINFAHGEIFMSGAFASFFVAEVFDQNGFLEHNALLAVVILMLISMAVSTMVAVLLERVAYRP